LYVIAPAKVVPLVIAPQKYLWDRVYVPAVGIYDITKQRTIQNDLPDLLKILKYLTGVPSVFKVNHFHKSMYDDVEDDDII